MDFFCGRPELWRKAAQSSIGDGHGLPSTATHSGKQGNAARAKEAWPAWKGGVVYTVRPYSDEDFENLLDAWCEALPLEALTPERFITSVLLDPNRERESLQLAVDGAGLVVGLVLCLILRRPLEKIGLMEHRGFITAFGVRPEVREEGVREMLLDAAEQFFRERGRREVAVSPYPTNYFVPGVDKERYADTLAFLRGHGYEEFVEAIAMDALIVQFEMGPELREREAELAREGIVVEPVTPRRLTAFLEFMRRELGEWLDDARGQLARAVSGQAPRNSVFLARDGEVPIGYCAFDGEHFGPFGVAAGYQGRGVGTVLLARTLLQMRMEGHHAAYVLWTGERAANGVYRRLGFTISRRFALLRKTLEGNGEDG